MRSLRILPEQAIARARDDAFMWIVWLLSVVARIGLFSRSARLRRWIAKEERFAERFIFVLATRRLYQRQRVRRHACAPKGFRRQRASRRLLFKCAHIRAKSANLWVRLERLRAAFENPERYILAFVRKLRRGLRASSIVIAAPAPEALCANPAPATAYANSS